MTYHPLTMLTRSVGALWNFYCSQIGIEIRGISGHKGCACQKTLSLVSVEYWIRFE